MAASLSTTAQSHLKVQCLARDKDVADNRVRVLPIGSSGKVNAHTASVGVNAGCHGNLVVMARAGSKHWRQSAGTCAPRLGARTKQAPHTCTWRRVCVCVCVLTSSVCVVDSSLTALVNSDTSGSHSCFNTPTHTRAHTRSLAAEATESEPLRHA